MGDRRRDQERFGFVLAQSRDPHRSGTIARFVCNDCGAEAEVRPKYPLNPEDVAKRCERDLGWDADGYRKSVARCPACKANRRMAGRGESPGKVIPMPTSTSMPKEVRMTVAKPNQTELTPDQRLKIRALLDKHFDDGAGCYLDGWSDQKIGEELNVPWALVTKLREVAYGPIRLDPEVVALRNCLAEFERRLKDAEGHWEILRGQLAATLADLKSRLGALEKKRGTA